MGKPSLKLVHEQNKAKILAMSEASYKWTVAASYQIASMQHHQAHKAPMKETWSKVRSHARHTSHLEQCRRFRAEPWYESKNLFGRTVWTSAAATTAAATASSHQWRAQGRARKQGQKPERSAKKGICLLHTCQPELGIMPQSGLGSIVWARILSLKMSALACQAEPAAQILFFSYRELCIRYIIL